jgi:hypothetical protein
MQREDTVDEAEMRAGIRDALRSLDAAAEEAIRNELAKSFDLGHSGRLQFEICPYFLCIHLVQTEDDVPKHVTTSFTSVRNEADRVGPP